MNSLENYLANEYPIDIRDVQDVEKLVCSVAQVYEKEYVEDLAWPYDITSKASNPPERLSQSTTAMILNALLRFCGYFASHSGFQNSASKGSAFPLKTGEKELDAALLKKIKSASDLLLNSIFVQQGKKTILQTESKTFGDNDVFTLAWLAEITCADWERIDLDAAKKWKKVANALVLIAKKRIRDSKKFSNPAALFSPPQGEAYPHAFPALRLLQIIRRLRGRGFGPLPDLYSYFEASLHEQLSFSSIPDSRFDPAELVFCLEGMLLCQKNTVDRTVFDRVFAVLSETQRDSAYWRPVKPYISTKVGLVLFPVSVEIANSLIRSCQIFDGEELRGTYASRAILLLRRYFQWLRARAVRFVATRKYEAVGWHSEHVNEPTIIHLWETSQVVDFLLAYRNSLNLHIARTTLVQSRFKIDNFKTEEWSELQEQLEPVTTLGPALEIYRDIGEIFVAKHADGKPENFSMLLYGPAGTGKTTVAESVAKALGRRLITVTVSDFLAEGGAQVEARAKSIFNVLLAQPASVILFDEIDHFLLDRDSDRYRDQETLFQFMTPGMLTKLNDLRRSERSIFIVATNYEDRIDPAIKRTGRIDTKYLVLPPDSLRREIILKSFLGTRTRTAFSRPLTAADWAKIRKASVFLGFKDLQAAIGSISRLGSNPTPDDFVAALSARARTTSLEAYGSRFRNKDNNFLPLEATPTREFLALTAMLVESKRPPTDRERAVFKVFLEMLNAQGTPKLDDKRVGELAPELSNDFCGQVAKVVNA